MLYLIKATIRYSNIQYVRLDIFLFNRCSLKFPGCVILVCRQLSVTECNDITCVGFSDNSQSLSSLWIVYADEFRVC